MKIVFISDIHANLPALIEVLKKIDKDLKPDLILFCGDIVGYGPFPNECIEILKEKKIFGVLGNHDLAVLNKIDYFSYNRSAIRVIEWTKSVIKKENIQWLYNLPFKIAQNQFECMHGAPPKPLDFVYLLDIDIASNLIKYFEFFKKITFIGHSHLTKVFKLNSNKVYEIISSEIHIENNFKYIVTVGSVGQPRDKDPRACFVLFDDKEMVIKYFRVTYEIRNFAEEMKKNNLPIFLSQRLYYGI